ncbi:MAG: cytochrome c biogenesis protein ResB [Candidatus Azosocius agrarius]|nr:MAG: cytochrome c biogenesis protein ResB [Gammaproteobacteria bacterium]
MIIKILSSTRLFCYLTLYFIFLLVIGTIAQKNLNPFYAQKEYFASYIFFLYNKIPLPGGLTITFLIILNLYIKIYKDKFKKNITSLIIHIGSFLLIFCGMILNTYIKEGNLLLYENEKNNYYNCTNKQIIKISHFTKSIQIKITKKNIIDKISLPFLFKITQNNKNYYLIKKNLINNKFISLNFNALSNVKNFFFDIYPKKNWYNINENLSIYKIFKYKNKKYYIQIKDKKYKLPFYISLHKFKKKNYPGTHISNKFKSIITIKNNKKNLNTTIKMNNPLKYDGYTFYQTAFIEKDKIKATILTIVKNKFSFFPYIASSIICFGLLINIINRRYICTK